MRLIITGDKSRYQFLRYIVESELISDNEEFRTERISEKNLFVTTEKERVCDNIYYSRKILPNTTLFFPAEFGENTEYNVDDRIICFNEFPYNTDKNIEALEQIISDGKYGQLEVVLVENSRNGLESDTTTNEMALNDAASRIKQKGIRVNRYTMGSRPDFLFWSATQVLNLPKQIFVPSLEKAKINLETFDSIYELEYEFDMGELVKDPKNRRIKYEKSIRGKNIWKEYGKKTCDFFLVKDNRVKNFCRKVYRNAIKEICIWNFDKDYSQLMKCVRNELKTKFNKMQALVFNGDRDSYDEFLNKNKVIYTYNQAVDEFFSCDIKRILKNRIEKDIKVMEEILNGYNY